jgi:hypothetical protein
MKTGAATADLPRFTALALSMVRAVLPNLQVLDTLFPASPFLLAGAPVELSWFADNIPDEAAEFYARFRQGGGARPILPFAAALPEVLATATAAGIPLLVALHTANAAEATETLSQAKSLPPLLLLAPEGANHALAILRDIGYVGHCFFRLVQGETEECFCLLSAESETPTLLRKLEAAGKAVAVDMRFANHGGRETDTLIIFLSVGCQTQTTASLNPLTFVHDAAKTPEGDDNYAWLWFTGEPQSRILLGLTAGRFHRVRITVPNALTTQNLHAARLLINGTVVKPLVEIWSEYTGAISAELPDTLEPPLVLGVWVPEGRVPEGGDSKLFICIDRIELSA